MQPHLQSIHPPKIVPSTQADLNMACFNSNSDEYIFTTYVIDPVASQYQCIYCDCRFTNTNVLITHLPTCQLKTDSFNCPECIQYFITRDHLDEHIIERHFLTHIGYVISSYFECNLCPYRTISDERIRSHVQKRVVQHAYVCCICFYNADNKLDLISHFKICIRSPPFTSSWFQCQACTRCFLSKSQYDAHILAEHPDSDVMKYITLCQLPENIKVLK